MTSQNPIENRVTIPVLVCVDDVHLRPRNCRRNKTLLDGIRMDMVIDLAQFALGRPANLFLLIRFQPLVIANLVKLELWRHP